MNLLIDPAERMSPTHPREKLIRTSRYSTMNSGQTTVEIMLLYRTGMPAYEICKRVKKRRTEVEKIIKNVLNGTKV